MGKSLRIIICLTVLTGIHIDIHGIDRDMIVTDHVPSEIIYTGSTMRDPLFPVGTGNADCYLRVDVPGQVETGMLIYRSNGGSWNTVVMNDAGGPLPHEYWAAALVFGDYDHVEYYFSVTGSGYDTTFVYGTDTVSYRTVIETTAMNNAFSFDVGAPATPTPPVSPTPTPSFTPTPGATETATPGSPTPTSETPTPVSTRTPTPTATPMNDYLMDLVINQTWFHAGDWFHLDAVFYNNTPQILTANLIVMLDVHGTYYFFPDWITSMDWEQTTNRSQPTTYLILDFPWEEDSSSGAGIRFYAAMMDDSFSIFYGGIDWVEFGWD